MFCVLGSDVMKNVEINLDEIKEHKHNLSKLFDKLSVAPFGEVLATPFNSEKTLITYAKLDYSSPDVKFDRNFDEVDKLILNAIYSFQRVEKCCLMLNVYRV